MIQLLKPLPSVEYDCPACRCSLIVQTWAIPGMWCVAGLRCPECGEEFYGALREGHGLFAPALIRSSDGSIVMDGGTTWKEFLARELKAGYQRRNSADLTVNVRRSRPVQGKPLIVNCLDYCYGHSLPKLFSLEYYLDRCPEYSLIVIIPRALEWMVPEGVAEIWRVDAGWSKLGGWYDDLDARFKELMARWPEVWLASAPAVVHSLNIDIRRFTGVQPFDVGKLSLAPGPKLTFIWRDDRYPGRASGPIGDRRHSGLRRLFPGAWLRFSRYRHRRFIEKVARALRKKLPDVDFAVVGMGKPGGFSAGIRDLRTDRLDAETERAWCRRYAESQLVAGLHGSNMMLPTAHAGAALTLYSSGYTMLVPFSDTILNHPQAGHPTMSALLRYRSIPAHTGARTVAEWMYAIVASFSPLLEVWQSHGDEAGEVVSPRDSLVTPKAKA